jgi:hypothetical protein
MIPYLGAAVSPRGRTAFSMSLGRKANTEHQNRNPLGPRQDDISGGWGFGERIGSTTYLAAHTNHVLSIHFLSSKGVQSIWRNEEYKTNIKTSEGLSCLVYLLWSRDQFLMYTSLFLEEGGRTFDLQSMQVSWHDFIRLCSSGIICKCN